MAAPSQAPKVVVHNVRRSCAPSSRFLSSMYKLHAMAHALTHDAASAKFLHDLVFKAAFQNAAALSVFCLIGWALYNNALIFSAFLQSLAWALLVGVGLHRVKRCLVEHAQDFLIRYRPAPCLSKIQFSKFKFEFQVFAALNGGANALGSACSRAVELHYFHVG